MLALFQAHSGLRYLVLSFALIHIGMCLFGIANKRAFSAPARALSGVVLGLIHTQIVLGISMVIMGTFYPALIGHLVMMLAAGTLATVMHVVNKRSTSPNFVRPLIGTGGALLLIIGGILAIGRPLIGSGV